MSASFLGMASKSPASFMRSYSCIFLTRALMVVKLVSIPPSQRSFTYGMPHLAAALAIGSWVCFLVPTNRRGFSFSHRLASPCSPRPARGDRGTAGRAVGIRLGGGGRPTVSLVVHFVGPVDVSPSA